MRQGISQSMANITSVLSHRVMKTHFSLKGIWKWDQQTFYFMTLGKMDWVSDIAYEHSNQLNIRRDFILRYLIWISVYLNNVKRDFSQETLYKKIWNTATGCQKHYKPGKKILHNINANCLCGLCIAFCILQMSEIYEKG